MVKNASAVEFELQIAVPWNSPVSQPSVSFAPRIHASTHRNGPGLALEKSWKMTEVGKIEVTNWSDIYHDLVMNPDEISMIFSIK